MSIFIGTDRAFDKIPLQSQVKSLAKRKGLSPLKETISTNSSQHCLRAEDGASLSSAGSAVFYHLHPLGLCQWLADSMIIWAE